MFLVIDFYELDLEVFEADIKINKFDNMKISDFISKICDGLNDLITDANLNPQNLQVSTESAILDGNKSLSTYKLNDWDTLYLKRR